MSTTQKKYKVLAPFILDTRGSDGSILAREQFEEGDTWTPAAEWFRDLEYEQWREENEKSIALKDSFVPLAFRRKIQVLNRESGEFEETFSGRMLLPVQQMGTPRKKVTARRSAPKKAVTDGAEK